MRCLELCWYAPVLTRVVFFRAFNIGTDTANPKCSYLREQEGYECKWRRSTY